MTYQNGLMADEDMQFLIAIAEKLVTEQRFFTVNLPFNTRLTNQDGGDVNQFMQSRQIAFAGIDFIKDMKNQYQRVTNEKCILIMPTDKMTIRTEVGELFGMKVYADPKCPKDKMLIQPPEQDQKST